MTSRSSWLRNACIFSAICAGLIASPLAHADQCAVVSRNQGDVALIRLRQPQTWVLELCEPCGQQLGSSARPYLVTHVARVPWEHAESADEFEVLVNGRGLDLAYTFVHVGGGEFRNLAALAGCPAEGVSASVTVPGWTPPTGQRRAPSVRQN